MLDMLAGWNQYIDKDESALKNQKEVEYEKVHDLYQLVGNLDVEDITENLLK